MGSYVNQLNVKQAAERAAVERAIRPWVVSALACWGCLQFCFRGEQSIVE